VKRDIDLVRELLLAIEALNPLPADAQPLTFLNLDVVRQQLADRYSADTINGHIRLLVDAGFLDVMREFPGNFVVMAKGLTWTGHDFLDSVRDPQIWRETKEGARKAGGFTVELLGKLARGFLAKKIEELTGVKLDL